MVVPRVILRAISQSTAAPLWLHLQFLPASLLQEAGVYSSLEALTPSLVKSEWDRWSQQMGCAFASLPVTPVTLAWLSQ